ncbi:MAG: hypothetical protein KC425_22190, partial [Anaerolineales bacterium]|nr:hypothetical protein [Anaerolineales bacterium]
QFEAGLVCPTVPCDDPAHVRRWAHLALIGGEIPSDVFDRQLPELKAVVELLRTGDFLAAQGRLDYLETNHPAFSASAGFATLQRDVELARARSQMEEAPDMVGLRAGVENLAAVLAQIPRYGRHLREFEFGDWEQWLRQETMISKEAEGLLQQALALAEGLPEKAVETLVISTPIIASVPYRE